MILFLFICLLLIGGFVAIIVSSSTSEVAANWPKYRCAPNVMPFAALYGHDTAENFEFCLKNIFKGQADQLLGPFGSVIGNFIGTLSTLVESANSMRLQMATLVGGVTNITKEFQDRITQVMFRTEMTAQRMKMLMGRMFATFYAIIYMGMSGITAVSNFGDTFLFKFLDTFCFPPETLIDLADFPEPIPIRDVKIGHTLRKTGGKVTGTFVFYSDGQEMVRFPDGTEVSTNHYVYSGKTYIKAKYHPDATLIAPWTGGLVRPLICLNTSDHKIPVGNQLFLDYDETEEGDQLTMEAVELQLNGIAPCTNKIREYSPSVAPVTGIRMADGLVMPANAVRLGSQLKTGRVAGIIKKIVHRTVILPTGDEVAEGTMVWDAKAEFWKRAGQWEPVHEHLGSRVFYSFVVTSTATIELASGLAIRDYVEIHSPDTEEAYAQKIAEASSEHRTGGSEC